MPSYADGGRWTPASSMAWKNAANAATSWLEASAKSRTGWSVKNTENMVPVDWTTCGTPAAVSASAAAALIVSPAAPMCA